MENGTLAQLFHEAESSAGLSAGSIVHETVRTRIKSGNVTGVAHQRKSPLEEIEPIIVENCVRLAEIGAALTDEEVMALTAELISGTKYEKELL